MFWKKKALVEPEVDLVECDPPDYISPEVQERIDWLHSRSPEDFAQVFNRMRNAIDVLMDEENADLKKNIQAYDKVVELFEKIRTLWFQIDWQLATDNHSKALFRISTETLPQIVHSLQVNSIKKGLSHAWFGYNISDYGYSYNRMGMHQSFKLGGQQILDELKNVQLEQTTDSFSLLKNIKPVTYSYQLPAIISSDETISASVEALTAAWLIAVERAYTIEDKYFVEQVALSYVPDAWKMFGMFRNSSEEQRAAATNILIEQFELMRKKLSEITDSSSDDSLMTMRAQLDFLKTKTHSHESALDLSK